MLPIDSIVGVLRDTPAIADVKSAIEVALSEETLIFSEVRRDALQPASAPPAPAAPSCLLLPPPAPSACCARSGSRLHACTTCAPRVHHACITRAQSVHHACTHDACTSACAPHSSATVQTPSPGLAWQIPDLAYTCEALNEVLVLAAKGRRGTMTQTLELSSEAREAAKRTLQARTKHGHRKHGHSKHGQRKHGEYGHGEYGNDE